MIVNDTHYHSETPKPIIDVLERARASGRRIRVRLGHTTGKKAGLEWMEEWHVEGTVGRSTGRIKIPLLIHSRRSLGGPGLLDHCIVRILDSKTHAVLYSHPKYRRPKLTKGPVGKPRKGWPTMVEAVYADGKLHAQFPKCGQADRWIAKMSR